MVKNTQPKNKELINQQKREVTVHKFKNFGNRIINLNKNYEIKYFFDQNEYKQSEKQEKVDRIYAELDNNNNKYIEEENEKNINKTPVWTLYNKKEMKNEIERNNKKDNLYNEEEKNNLKDA